MKLDGTISRINLAVKELNEVLAKLKKEEKREDGEESPGTDGPVQCPISPIKVEQ